MGKPALKDLPKSRVTPSSLGLARYAGFHRKSGLPIGEYLQTGQIGFRDEKPVRGIAGISLPRQAPLLP